MDILARIDKFIGETEASVSSKYISSAVAIQILEYIISEVQEDEILLLALKEHIENDWKRTNHKLIDRFYKILEFYGIVGESKVRKTILETKGKMVVRKFVQLKTKERILKLLNSEKYEPRPFSI